MSVEIRNKDKLTNAYWDKGYSQYIINSTTSFNEKTMVSIYILYCLGITVNNTAF